MRLTRNPAGRVPTKGRGRIGALREAGRFAEAERLAAAQAKETPEDPAAQTELGLVHLYAGRPAAALAPFQQAVRLAPNEATHHYNLASALELLGREAEAMTGFRRVLSLDPTHPDGLERLANLLLTQGRRDEAIACFRAAAAAAPNRLRAALNETSALLEEGKVAEVEALLRRTIETFPESAEAKRSLATILREQGRFEEAIPLLEQATAGSATEAATAYFDLAMTKRVTAADGAMIGQMEALARLDTLPGRYRARVHFGLGKAFDDLGRYAEAMRHFDAANRLAGQGKTYDRAQFGAGVNRLIASFAQGSLAATRPFGSPSERPVLIVGMPRSGTSLVEQILSSHPEVAGGGELDFWNRQAAALAEKPNEDPADQIRQAARDYEALLMRIGPGARRVTDKMPGNFLWLGLIHRAFPKARIIHCRRHPLDTCLSNYFTKFTVPAAYTNNKGDLAFYYRAYERLMAHWRQALPAEALLEVQYEELVAAPETFARRMVAFIGLEWDDACLHPEANRRIVKTASLWQVRQPIHRGAVERWRRYEPWLGELGQLLRPPEAPAAPRRSAALLALLQRAAERRRAGQFQEAARLLGQAAGESPNDARIENEAGLIHLQRHAWAQAAESFERAIALEAQMAVAHYNLGCALERCRQPEAAIAAYRKAIQHAPNLVEAHDRLGNLLHARGAREEALACFRRVHEIAPGSTLGRLAEVKTRMEERQGAGVEELLRGIVAADPKSSEAWRLLGVTLSEQGRFPEAAAALEQSIARDPEQVAAFHDLVQTRRMSEADRPLIQRIEARLNHKDLNKFDRTLLHFALGKCFDDLGQAAAAIGQFEAGNRLENSDLSFNRAGFADRVERTISLFGAERMSAAAEPGAALPLLILGMPRSGTTLVEQILSAHRNVAGGGELNFWSGGRADADFSLPEPAGLAALGEQYLEELRRIGPGAARVTDKDPYNFLRIGLIHLAVPGARFIHCRRDPLDTALSIYFTRFGTRQDFAYDRSNIVFFYSQYEKLMAHWRSVLPEGRLFEIEYEALVRDPEPLARRLVAFAGLDWDEACLSPEHNPRRLKTASLWQARQAVHPRAIGRWRRYEPWLGELRSLTRGEE